MATQLKGLVASIGDQFVDLFWPRITGPRELPPKFDEQAYNIRPELLDTVETMLVHQMTQAENRMASVDRKLLALFRLTSLLAMLVSVLLAGAASLITRVDQNESILASIAIMLIVYAMLQLVRAVKATINGLEASRYASPTKGTILPLKEEEADSYRNRQIRDILYVIDQHLWATNNKVNQMQLAYRSIKNTLLPLVGLIVAAICLAYLRLT